MRYVLSAFGVLAALVFVLASGTMNWIFWSGQGNTDLEGKILGSVSGAVDVFKCLLPFFIARSWMNRKWVFVGIGSLVFALFMSFSLLSAIGFAAGNRGLVAGGREAVTVRLEQATADLSSAEQKRKALTAHRPATVVEEALRGVQQDRRYTSSKSCTEATAKDSREFCKGFFDVRAELAIAVEEDRLSRQIETLGRELRGLKEQGAGQDKDPQARMLSVLSGLQIDSAQKVLIIFVAVLVELGAAFGMYLATGWASEGKPVKAAPLYEKAPYEPEIGLARQMTSQQVASDAVQSFIDIEPEPEPESESGREPLPKREPASRRPKRALGRAGVVEHADKPRPEARQQTGTAVATVARPRRLEQFDDGSWGVK